MLPVGPGSTAGNDPPAGIGENVPPPLSPVSTGGNELLVGPGSSEEIDCGGCGAMRSSTTFEIKSSWFLHRIASSIVHWVGSSS